MFEDVIKSVVGIALVVVFLTFAVKFIEATFGNWNGASVLQEAIANNDSKILMDGLMMRKDSLIVVILMGVFIAIFMTAISKLSSKLFNVQISEKYYETAKKDMDLIWKDLKKLGSAIKK